MNANELFTEHQRTIASRVLDFEGTQRKHLVVSLSGAHAYGFPSPDSDLDLKAVHVAPTLELLGFPRAQNSRERLEVIEGVEIDYSSNEVGGVLLGALKGNGNYLERFLSGFEVRVDPVVQTLKPLLQRSLSRRVYRHYAGFAAQQRGEWEKTDRRSTKKLLYVLRTTLTGAHLLTTGEVVTDVTGLLAKYGLDDAMKLIEAKRAGERSELSDTLRDAWTGRVSALFATLDRAFEQSPLPEEPPNADEVEAWLVQLRRSLVSD